MQTLSLDGTWLLRWSDGIRGNPQHAIKEETDLSRYIDAQVPGEVHLDLIRHGWITDPYVGANALACRWVEECLWSYRRDFDAPAEACAARAWLAFDGLDLVATIYLNGQEVGRHANFFTPCRVEVTGKLRPGRNWITVQLDSGLFDVADKPVEAMIQSPDQRLHKRHWLRKPQCQFGWDWSTRLINIGIHKPVRLEWTDLPARLDQLVPLARLSPDLARGTLEVRQFVEGLNPPAAVTLAAPAGAPAGEVEGEWTIELTPPAGAGPARTIALPVKIKPGLEPLITTIDVESPALWWPLNHGPQDRYGVTSTLRVAGRVVGRASARVGFRHVRVNQDPHPVTGRYFVIEVNGRPIFAKGANFVPADMIFARIDAARYETLIDRALEANFNFLRIWGGGLYESDDFYELCDAKGILVWQEFIYACARYPTFDEAFSRNALAEAAHHVRRLACRPSLIIWCGNNEMEWGSWDWHYGKTGMLMPDHGFFHVALPKLLAKEDPTRYYQPSSPFSPDLRTPNDNDLGDQHPWQIGFSNTDFRDYRKLTCRFPNEGGMLGPTSLPTLRKCLSPDPAPGGPRINSLAWRLHDNSVDSWGEPSFPDQALRQWLGKEIGSLDLEEFVYWSGLVQGEALREYCEAFRRRMFDSAAAVFWMYNDCWPAARSWTIVDYDLRRTPAFHPVRRALAPVALALSLQGDEVVVTGSNDLIEPVAAELRFGLFTLAGDYPLDRTRRVELAPNAATRLASFPAGSWKEPLDTLAFATLTAQGHTLARTRLVQPLFKELRWVEPRVSVRRAGDRAIFESPTFAWGLCLDLDGEAPLADNFFDLYPGQPYTIAWSGQADPRVLRVGNLAPAARA